eukprot:1206026-Karenia_brevis.AAC.1
MATVSPRADIESPAHAKQGQGGRPQRKGRSGLQMWEKNRPAGPNQPDWCLEPKFLRQLEISQLTF